MKHPATSPACQHALLAQGPVGHVPDHEVHAGAVAECTQRVARFNDLIKENGVLARELGKAQQRCTQVIAEKSAEIERLDAGLVQQRAIGIEKDIRIAYLVQELEKLKTPLPDDENTSRLQKKLARFSARQAELEAQNAQLRQQLGEAHHALSLRAQEDAVKLTTGQRQERTKEVPITFHLEQKTVLCVGDRNGNVANYRDVIEKAGGHFAHHDGGLGDKQSALDASLAAADLVICQTGCISHNAYWRVKDFCKRTGKQCVFVENPSTSSLTRSLQQIAGDDTAIERGENQIAS